MYFLPIIYPRHNYDASIIMSPVGGPQQLLKPLKLFHTVQLFTSNQCAGIHQKAVKLHPFLFMYSKHLEIFDENRHLDLVHGNPDTAPADVFGRRMHVHTHTLNPNTNMALQKLKMEPQNTILSDTPSTSIANQGNILCMQLGRNPQNPQKISNYYCKVFPNKSLITAHTRMIESGIPASYAGKLNAP